MMDNFRKIDIDAFDEDVLTEEDLYEPDTRSPAEVIQIARGKAGEVRGLIGRGDAAGALALVLADPPYGAGVEDAKNQTLSSLLEILNSIKSSDIPTLVRSLNVEQQDTLMKYLYKGMTIPEEVNSAVLLTWHEKLTEVAGTGCIVRVMTDRRTV